MKTKSSIKGKLTIEVINKDGSIDRSVTVDNLLMPAGEVYIANRLSVATITKLSDIAIGDGSTDPTVLDTTLENELERASIIGDVAYGPETNQSNVLAAIPAGEEILGISEAGLFYGNSMFSRVTFSTIDKTAEQALSLIWTITIHSDDPNLIQNGHFSVDDGGSYWVLGTNFQINLGVLEKLVNDATWSYTTQVFSTTIGQQYYIQAKVVSNSGEFKVQALDSADLLISEVYEGAGNTGIRVVEFTATSTTSKVGLGIFNLGSFDDVVVTPRI